MSGLNKMPAVRVDPGTSSLSVAMNDIASTLQLPERKLTHAKAQDMKEIKAISFNRSSTILAMAGGNIAAAWDVATEKPINTFTGHTGLINSVSLSIGRQTPGNRQR